MSKKVETTLGDLIAALTDIAIRAGNTEEKSYQLVSETIEKLFGNTKESYPEV